MTIKLHQLLNNPTVRNCLYFMALMAAIGLLSLLR
jgi:hypothetical protein